MLFSNVMKTLILIAIFIAIPVILFRISVKGMAQLSEFYRTRSGANKAKGQ